ncbi:MAG: ABC transporter permease [Hyphomonas sp.]|nr:ABC transporter permease [Hyphomonas sp.]
MFMYMPFFARSHFDLGVVVRDLLAGARRPALWIAFATDEIQQRYRRSRLGLAWIVISYLVFVASITVFFGHFSDVGHSQFTVYVAVNFAIFTFLLGNVTDGCAVFRVARTWIKSAPLPHSIYIFKSIARSLFVFAINFQVAVAILFGFGFRLHPIAWMAVPAFFVLLLNVVFVQLAFGYLAARVQDIDHLMQSVTRVFYFTTPVLWVRNENEAPGLRKTISELNPFTHALEIFSAPILGKQPDPHSWAYIGIFTVVMFVIALVIGGLSHRRLPYWV